MKAANYLGTPEVLRELTQLYRPDGVTPYPYWKISVRPAGSINASARDMARYVQFYLNRGSVGGTPLLPESAIDRMERVATTYAAQEGLTNGYGLYHVASPREGWVYFGHNGGVMGGLTEFAYLPELGVGYCFMINSGNGRAFQDISRAVRRYITRGTTPPVMPAAVNVSPSLADGYSGWYEAITPRNDIARFLERLAHVTKVTLTPMGLITESLGPGDRTAFLATGERSFRRERDPLATIAMIRDQSEGTLIQMGGATYRRIPAVLLWLQVAVSLFAAALGVGALIFACVWVPRRFWGGLRGATHLRVRALPLCAALAGIALFAMMIGSSREIIERLGRVTPWSVGVFIASLMFPLLAAIGLVEAWRCRRVPMPRLAWWHSFLTSLMLTVVAAYLACWGIVGIRTWA